MFKLVVLTALFAAAAAQTLGYPFGYGGSLAYSGGYYPYSGYSSYYNSPLATAYAAPLAHAVAPVAPFAAAHLIKKRSVVATAPVVASASYVPTSYLSTDSYYSGYPYASNYLAHAAPLASAYSYGSPLVSSAIAPVHYATPYTHLIKKRSVVAAPLVSSLAHTYAAHTIVPTTYATAHHYTNSFASPYYNNFASPYFNYASPLSYSSPFYIKK